MELRGCHVIDDVSVPGVLNVACFDDDCKFDWIPDELERFDLATRNFRKCELLFLLSQMKSIQVANRGPKDGVSVKFSIANATTFSTFKFPASETGTFDELVERLEASRMIVRNVHYSNTLLVKMTTARNLRLKEGCLLLHHAQALCYYDKAVSKIHFGVREAKKPVTREEFEALKGDDGAIADFDGVRKRIWENGLMDDKARFAVWPYLFGYYSAEMTLEEKQRNEKQKLLFYDHVRRQRSLRISIQDQHDGDYRVIENDMKRTVKEGLFTESWSPAHQLASDVLVSYKIYDGDVGYVQGMNDLCTAIVNVFIDECTESNATMKDGTVVSLDDAEAFIFWNFVGLMTITREKDLLSDMNENQQHIAERVLEIVGDGNAFLSNWFAFHQLESLRFMQSSLLLLFKRDFAISALLPMWDCVFSAEYPHVFIQCLAASCLFKIFPLICTANFCTVEDIITVYGGAFRDLDSTDIIELAQHFYKKIGASDSVIWFTMDYCKIPVYTNFHSRYLKPLETLQ